MSENLGENFLETVKIFKINVTLLYSQNKQFCQELNEKLTTLSRNYVQFESSLALFMI